MKMHVRSYSGGALVLAASIVLFCCKPTLADLYVVDHPSNADDVRQYNTTTGAVIDSTLVNLPFATGLTLGPDGLLYVGTSDPGEVFRYNAASGAQGGTGPFVVYNGMPPTPDPRDVINPQGMRFGSDGNLYIADEGGNQNIHVYSPTGISLTVLTPPGDFSSPTAVAFSPAGNLYAVSGSGVAEYNFTSQTFSDIVQAATGGPTNPIDLGFGADGKLYLLDFGTGSIFRYNSDGTGQSTFITLNNTFTPAGMAFGPDGSLYVSGIDLNSGQGEVLQYAANGTFDQTLISGLDNPGFLTVTPEPDAAVVMLFGLFVLRRLRSPSSRRPRFA
jgi:sugar lactone lactonase YvrE